MKQTTIIVFTALIALFALAAVNAAKTKAELMAARAMKLNDCSQCLPGDNCCPDLFMGSTCYNPSTHHCTNIQGTAQSRLCGISDLSCSDGIAGKVCYDPTRYDCVSVEGANTVYKRLCPTGFKACGESYSCYDPSKNSCCNGSICAAESS